MVFQKKKQQKENELDNALNAQDIWMDSDEHWICKPCLFYSKQPNCPEDLKCYRKGKYGYFSKKGQTQLTNSSRKTHCVNPLHVWCVGESKKEKEETKIQTEIYDRKNELAGKKVLRNGIFCLQRSLGSQDFVALNAKDFLAEVDSGHLQHATKNDSAAHFFELRDIIFKEVSAKIKKFFNEKVHYISVTLDKVTVQRASFTVICTYFFYDGRIHVILNKIEKLTTSDYNGPGTADMVIRVLCDTLGVSMIKLAKILVHFIYDGVYANSEERTEGGGCLELRKYIEKALNLPKNSISGC